MNPATHLGAPLLAVLAMAWTCSPAVAQGVIYKPLGQQPFEGLGGAVSRLDDLDGDGWDDWMAGGAGAPGAGIVRVWSGQTGSELLQVAGPIPGAGFGKVLANAGDVNCDGVADFMAADPLYSGLATNGGAAWVVSGLDGSVLYSFIGQQSYESMGASLAGGVDLDGDGCDDFAIGTASYIGPDLKGEVRVHSGSTGAVLFTIVGDAIADGTARALAMMGDLDGDGTPDLVTSGAGDFASGQFYNGAVRAASGRNGKTLWVVVGESSSTELGFALANAGDVDGDGLDDVAVGSPNDLLGGYSPGSVRILSGADGSQILFVPGETYETLGRSVSGLGDYDGDGVPDVIAGTKLYVGRAVVLSGATGERLLELQIPNPDFSWFGYSVAGLGDLNGDGLGDFAVGWRGNDEFAENSGAVLVYLTGGEPVDRYCVAKPSSAGCVPGMDWSGLLSLSIGDNFHLIAEDVISNQIGLLAWSRGVASTPFFGGTLCLAPPVIRTLAQPSSGNAVPDCSGTFSFHFSQAYAQQQGVTVGEVLRAQYWYRDPTHPDATGVGLSNAVEFSVFP